MSLKTTISKVLTLKHKTFLHGDGDCNIYITQSRPQIFRTINAVEHSDKY